MAKKPIEISVPDADDLDGQSGGSENGTVGNKGPIDTARTDDVVGVTSLDAAAEYARDGDGNIIRNKDGTPARKRGRKPGGGSGGTSGGPNPKRKAANSQNLVDSVKMLSDSIKIVHIGIAAVSKMDFMALDDKESDALAKSVVNVMDQFDVTPDPRVTAIVGLVTTAGTIYGPRFVVYKMREKEKKNNETLASTNIATFSPLSEVKN